jgi:hypothetical protein
LDARKALKNEKREAFYEMMRLRKEVALLYNAPDAGHLYNTRDSYRMKVRQRGFELQAAEKRWRELSTRDERI